MSSFSRAFGSQQFAVGIELLKQISKFHVFTVLRRLPKRIWSQMESVSLAARCHENGLAVPPTPMKVILSSLPPSSV